MTLTYLGTFYPTERHDTTEFSPYESMEDVLQSDRDTSEYYPLDEVIRTHSEWIADFKEFSGIYQDHMGTVLFNIIDQDTFKAWRVI